MKKCYAALVCLAPVALGFQLPFEIPFFKQQAPGKQVILPDDSPHAAPRVAIIGAGAGGTSAAFWISKAKERFGLDVEVDVYDKANYIGGRSTTVYPFGDRSLREVELGGSIFVKANKNMWRATDEFNLTRRDFKEEDYETTVWDGETFLFRYKGSWWDTIKLMWRYGLTSPRTTTAAVTNMINSYLKLYSTEVSHWSNMTELTAALGFENLVSSTISEYLLSQGVSSQYIYEVVEAATLVNYGQDADAIHALEGAASMAADNAAGVDGGNYLVFENFLNHSKANVYLETPVTSVLPKKSGSTNHWTLKSARGTQHYKGVILAAPFHQADIAVPPSIADQIPPQPYVHLHVTLLATTSASANPAYFGLPEGSSIPQMILTSQANARHGGKLPEFNSMSYHGQVREGEYYVKIFSDAPISDEWLDFVFNGTVTWVHRKLWQSYPKLPPTTSFPPIKLDEGFYYVNAFEPFISTMETETVASRNVVDLLLDDLFQSGICGPKNRTETETPTTHSEDFVYGWDC